MPLGPWAMETKNGYRLDEVISAIQKAIRRADTDGAVFFAREANVSGYGGWVWRRLFVITSEDIGLAEPNAPAVIAGLWTMSEVLRANLKSRGDADKSAPQVYPMLQLLQATWFLTRSSKNRELADMDCLLLLREQRHQLIEVADIAEDMHTAAGRAMGRGLVHFDGGVGPEFARYIANEVEIDGNEWQGRYYAPGGWTPPADPSSRKLE